MGAEGGSAVGCPDFQSYDATSRAPVTYGDRRDTRVPGGKYHMSDYEACLRKVFPALYAAAIEVCDDEEEAAWIAQVAFLESYAELLR